MAALVTYAFDKRRWDPVNTNLEYDKYEALLDIYGTNNSLELNATQIVNEFFHDKDEDLIGSFYSKSIYRGPQKLCTLKNLYVC